MTAFVKEHYWNNVHVNRKSDESLTLKINDDIQIQFTEKDNMQNAFFNIKCVNTHENEANDRYEKQFFHGSISLLNLP